MTEPDRTTPEFAENLGRAIVAISYYMCGVHLDGTPLPGGVLNGYDKLAPVYVATTEGRDGPGPEQRKRYSSCADQLHAIIQRVGVEGPFVNRGANHVYGAAQMTRLEPVDPKHNPNGCPAARYARPGEVPPAGSLCLIWTPGTNDAHALVILGPGSDAGHIRTGNYGASGMSAATAPGANVADSPFVAGPGGYMLIGKSRRRLQVVITPAALAPLTGQIDLTGVEGAGFGILGEIADALGAKY